MAFRPDSPEDVKPLLLHLPYSIRHRMYLYVGVVPWDHQLPSMIDLRPPRRRYDRVSFHGLLLSCRVLYGEVSRLLYSSHAAIIHYRSVSGKDAGASPSLQPLRNLTDSSLASIRQLKIVLNQNGCHETRPADPRNVCWRCCDYPGTTHFHFGADYCKPHLHDEPLRSSQHLSGPLLDERCRTVQHLSSRIGPDVLELALVCDLDHTLADTCRSPEAELHTPSPSPGATGFHSLPRELRLQTLEYTDLVIPSREVMWTRFERAQRHYFSGCHGPEYPHARPQFLGPGTLGCFCRARHASFSPICRCWAPPTPLFLVCKGLTEDARFIFFSQNRFVVSDSLAAPCTYFPLDILANSPWHEHTPDWAEYLSIGLGEAPPPSSYPAERLSASSLNHLRFLEVVFPPYNHNCWPDDAHPALVDWAATIDWLQDKLNINKLTLRFTVAGSEFWPPHDTDKRVGYDRVARPLGCLGRRKGGLARFHADLSSPWMWFGWVNDEYIHTGERPDINLGQLNEHVERLVLGDRYDTRESEGVDMGIWQDIWETLRV
ncbi:uncharacterized protein C8A04DRAFT_40159 [Dichotomopilus funicola]|uniref:Uncharacterized protein n=1 Tax=Dichotomopilus funicola TaxID=1934379 RepID=A0AAN6UVS9_9PEZI|nr:hypothetical protein C8A04DRAFT_40159 [Dichotomopilus funicola]